MKRILIAVVVILGVATALTLIPGDMHKAPFVPVIKAGSASCLGGYCPIPPQVTVCAAGGTNPYNGAMNNFGWRNNQGIRTYMFLAPVAGCQHVITNLSGSVLAGSPPAGVEVGTFGIWKTSDSTCAPAGLTNSSYTSVVGTNSSAPSVQISPPAGVTTVAPVNTGLCVGWASNYSDWWTAVNFSYGEE